eukprot:TRINITY_DN4967_c0_g1_i1.p1 TRINITY_DN4967_c0_g1~~TRINITY_DN4967_c0_g1_i1.p1  ORF type:complete len:106 (-),score=33.57 TRINITY_DN4967_c0_g1_i1:199-480(-)
MRRWRGGLSFFKIGVPFLGSIILGSYWLSFFTQNIYVKHDNKVTVPEDVKDTFKKRRRNEAFDLEKEYEKIMTQIDLDQWQNKRIPRPEGEDD